MQYYQIRTGKSFRKWFEKLRNHKAIKTIRIRIARMLIGDMGDHKYLEDGIYEARIHLSPGYRIYYSFSGDVVIILLCGGTKQRQSDDIRKAKRLLEEWRKDNV